MNCPTCNEGLVMTERSGVEIDYCPKCRGVWLDRGELDKIIEKGSQSSGSSAPPQNNNRFDDRDRRDRDDDRDRSDYRNDPNRRPRKKEGFLGDLFDF